MRKFIQVSPRDTILNNGNRTKLTISFNCDEQLDKKSFEVYSNQLDVARKILGTFHQDRKIVNISVVAHTQSGKTGTMLAVLKLIAFELDIVPIENIYIITGLSSTDWKKQTSKNFPDDCGIQDRIFHLPELKKKFGEEIKNKKNVLIMMDEVQLAAKPGQTIDKCFQDFGLEKLYENDIKIVEFSATPDGTLYDLHTDKWDGASKIILAEPGEGYFGSFEYLKKNRVRQYKDLCGYDDTTGLTDPECINNVRELDEFVKNFSRPKYHIIRTRPVQYGEATLANFRSVFGDNCSYRTYDGARIDIEKINDLLSVKPSVNTFIFVKQLLRCSNDLKTKNHIGIVYELFNKKPSNSVIAQGLLGRVTGYNVSKHILVWTDVDTIKRYRTLWDAGFSKEARGVWDSSTTKNKGGKIVSKGTFNDTISNSADGNQDNFTRSKEVSDSQSEIEKKAKEMVPNSRRVVYKTNENGFKMCSITGGPKVHSLEDVLTLARSENKCSNMPKKMDELKVGEYTHRRYVCYENINDISTEKFVIIWCKRHA